MPTAHLLFQGFALGVGAAAPMGPVNAEIARRTVLHGFRAGFFLGCGAVSVDVNLAILSSMSVGHSLASPMVGRIVAILGGVLLAGLGARSLLAARRRLRSGSREGVIAGPVAGVSSSLPLQPHRHYVTGVLMTATSPMTLLFWFVGVPAAPALSGSGHAATEMIWVAAGVFVATLTWVVCFAGAIHWLRQNSGPWLSIAADPLGGLILLAFAGVVICRVALAPLP